MKKMLEEEDRNGQRKKNTACPDQTVALSWQQKNQRLSILTGFLAGADVFTTCGRI